MYECTHDTMKSSKVIKITTFDQNQFMTYYLIFNFRPTYFSYFLKITAISISDNVKKLVDQKWSIPVVKGLTDLMVKASVERLNLNFLKIDSENKFKSAKSETMLSSCFAPMFKSFCFLTINNCPLFFSN